MRRPDRTFDPFSESPVDGVIAATCSVEVKGTSNFFGGRGRGGHVNLQRSRKELFHAI